MVCDDVLFGKLKDSLSSDKSYEISKEHMKTLLVAAPPHGQTNPWHLLSSELICLIASGIPGDEPASLKNFIDSCTELRGLRNELVMAWLKKHHYPIIQLLLACRWMLPSVARHLLLASPRRYDLINQTLGEAALRGHCKTVMFLCRGGADVRAYDHRALLNASAEGHTDIVYILLKYGADSRAENDSPFILAMCGRHHWTQALLDHWDSAKQPMCCSFSLAFNEG